MPRRPSDPEYDSPFALQVNNAPGMVVPGNIDNLFQRPVLKNEDGSWSTTISGSFQDEDGLETLIPTVIDGKRLSWQDAINMYRMTGKHLGKFDSVRRADVYAQWLHELQSEIQPPRGQNPNWGLGTGRAEATVDTNNPIIAAAIRALKGR